MLAVAPSPLALKSGIIPPACTALATYCWPALALRPQGLVFLAFGFNMVDVGGLLGGRLDEGLFKVVPAAAIALEGEAGSKAARDVKRAITM